MINIKGNLVFQSSAGEVQLTDEEDKLILHVKDWDTMDFLISTYRGRLKKLLSQKNNFVDQTIIVRVQDTDVLSWKGTVPMPINVKSYFRLIRTYLKN